MADRCHVLRRDDRFSEVSYAVRRDEQIAKKTIIIAVGSHEIQVIYTPGHASDGIVLNNKQDKILISSDTLWENDTAVMTLRVEGSTAYIRKPTKL